MMGSQKRAKYLQKRKKKLQAKEALAHADARLVQLLEKRSRLIAERDALIADQGGMFQDRELSNRIVWLAETIFPEIEEVDDFQNACDAVIMAWNVSVRGEGILPDTVTPESLEIIRVLAERKKEAFPEDDRFIADHWWEDEGGSLVVRAEIEEG